MNAPNGNVGAAKIQGVNEISKDKGHARENFRVFWLINIGKNIIICFNINVFIGLF